MRINFKKTTRLLVVMLSLLALTMPSLAQEGNAVKSSLDKTQDGRYRISSAREYELFRKVVATGNPYANAVLEANITISNSAIGWGSEEFHYRGTFDGQGHTIEIASQATNTDSQPWGLFQYTEPGCVIRNLKVTGTISFAKAQQIGSLIGSARGTKVENCISDVTIEYGGTGCVGGLVGISHGETFFENCAFIGKIHAPNAEACYGFVGKNVHMVSLKSNYVATTFKVGETTKTGQFMEVVRKDCQTILNNYACHEVVVETTGETEKPEDAGTIRDAENGFPESVEIRGKDMVVVKSVSLEDVSNGSLCLDLNIKGRNGVVWRQYNDRPYPFQVDGSMMAVKDFDGKVMTSMGCDIREYDENHVCSYCGALDPDSKVEPLQKRGDLNGEDEVTIGYLRYKINKASHLDTAELRRNKDSHFSEVNAAHIPETINVDGEVYRVDFIQEFAFEASKIEYLYIGKNVDNIYNNTFNNCYDLKYIHIADGGVATNFGTNTIVGLLETKEELFHESPLETLYIGRNVKWNPSHDCPFQDKDSYKEVFFGPKVTCVGNYYYDKDPEKGWYDELFDDSKIESYYFMGDDSCLEENRTLLVSCAEGLEKATKCYINRTFSDDKDYYGYILCGLGIIDSVFDNCENLIYGPYVKNVPALSFNDGQGIPAYHPAPKMVDFTNAFNLEEIGDYAFKLCDKTHFVGTFENTKLKKVGVLSFFKCSLMTKIVIPSTMTNIGVQSFACIEGAALTFNYSPEDLTVDLRAFGDSEKIGSIYHGRNMKYVDGCPFKATEEIGTIVIAPEITELPVSSYTHTKKLGALTFAPSDQPLSLKGEFHLIFAFTESISSLYMGRKIIDHNGEERITSWGDTPRGSLLDLSYGSKLTEVNDDLKGFKNLQTVLLRESIKKVEKETFQDCTGLKTLFAMGDITISDNAFKGCSSLEQVFLMGKELTLGESAFADCNKIKQVVVGLTEDPKKDTSKQSAFTDDVYKNANLVCAGDREYTKVEFTREPWKSFQNRQNENNKGNYEYGHTSDMGEYNRAYMDHHFDMGKYELVYLPFNLDSYYFGSDAEIYRLDENEGNYSGYSENLNGLYDIVNVRFNRQDIAQTMKLLGGLYIVNTKYKTEGLEAHPNLYEGTKVLVNNGKQTYTRDNQPDIVVNEEAKTLQADDNAFIYQDGVIKHVASEVTTTANGIAWYKTETNDDKERVVNLVDDNINVLISSSKDLGFDANLEGYTTFYDRDYAYEAPEWCEVYIVIQNDYDGTPVLERLWNGIINKDLPVLIKSADGVPANLKEYLKHTTQKTTSPLFSYNLLRGVGVDTKASELVSSYDYVFALSKDDGKVGFYRIDGDKVMPAGTAYIPPFLLTEGDRSKTSILTFGDATGVNHAAVNQTANHTIYDLMGRSLKNAGFKGIYIISGKKVAVY